MKKNYCTVLYVIAILSFFATCYSVIYLNKKVELYKKSMEAREVVLKQDNGYLMWKYDDESNWNNLYDLNNLKGKDGINGKDGTNGIDGKDGINGVNGKDGTNGTDGKNGQDGREVEFRVDGTLIQWKYTNQSDDLWNDLFDLSTLNNNNNNNVDDNDNLTDGN